MITPLTRGLALLAVTYVAAYFLLARPSVWIGSGFGWISFPDYRGLPPTLFEPLHALDKKFFRPYKWSGSFPEPTPEEMNLLGFDWFTEITNQRPAGAIQENLAGPASAPAPPGNGSTNVDPERLR